MRKIVLNNVEYLEENGIYDLVEKQFSYKEMGGTYKLEKDGMSYSTFNFIEKRRPIRKENYEMLHTTYLSMKYPELYAEIKREDKIRQRQIEINN